jgi:hypothetical protein
MENQDLNEQIQAKADELSITHKCKVHPILFTDPDTNENVIGYLKEPPRHVKLKIIDKGMTHPFSAASDIVDAYIIKDESDERIYSETGDDKYYLGACGVAQSIIQTSINQFKKK